MSVYIHAGAYYLPACYMYVVWYMYVCIYVRSSLSLSYSTFSFINFRLLAPTCTQVLYSTSKYKYILVHHPSRSACSSPGTGRYLDVVVLSVGVCNPTKLYSVIDTSHFVVCDDVCGQDGITMMLHDAAACCRILIA